MTRRRVAPRAKRPEADPARESGLRRCIVSGESRERAELLRFVVGPDGEIVPDLANRLPGRGLWVAADRDSIAQAVERRRFQYAARRALSVAPDLVARVEALLARRALEFLGLARRAGEVVVGFEKTRAWLEAGRCAVLLSARDGAAGGRDKLARLAGDAVIVSLFDSGELSLALGRQNVVHAALCHGGLADRFRVETSRLAGFRVFDVVSAASAKEGVT